MIQIKDDLLLFEGFAQWKKTLKNHKVGLKWYHILSRAKMRFVYVYKSSCNPEKNYADRKKVIYF